MGLYSEGLIIGRIFASESWAAYFRDGLFISLFISFFFFWEGWGGLIIGILPYFKKKIASVMHVSQTQERINSLLTDRIASCLLNLWLLFL